MGKDRKLAQFIQTLVRQKSASGGRAVLNAEKFLASFLEVPTLIEVNSIEEITFSFLSKNSERKFSASFWGDGRSEGFLGSDFLIDLSKPELIKDFLRGGI